MSKTLTQSDFWVKADDATSSDVGEEADLWW